MTAHPSITAVRLTGARDRAELPLLVLGPAVGTSATRMWGSCAAGLADSFDLLAWDLPGHGHNRAVPDEPFTLTELAAGVLDVVGDLLAQRGDPAGRFAHAGVGVGGAVGVQLLLDRRVTSAVVLGAEPGAVRWPDGSGDGGGDGPVLGDLSAYDLSDRLADVAGTVLGVDRPDPREEPEAVARLVRGHVLGEVFAEPAPEAGDDADIGRLAAAYDEERVLARPGLDPRSRTLVALAAVAARGDQDVLARHVRAARAHGVTAGEIRELFVQLAVHGVPGAEAAYRLSRGVLDAPVEGGR